MTDYRMANGCCCTSRVGELSSLRLMKKVAFLNEFATRFGGDFTSDASLHCGWPPCPTYRRSRPGPGQLRSRWSKLYDPLRSLPGVRPSRRDRQVLLRGEAASARHLGDGRDGLPQHRARAFNALLNDEIVRRTPGAKCDAVVNDAERHVDGARALCVSPVHYGRRAHPPPLPSPSRTRYHAAGT